MDTNHIEVKQAIADYLIAWSRLKDLGVLTNKKDFTSQLGEFLTASIYNGQPSASSIQRDWDLILADGQKVQVKTHAKAATNDNRWTPVPYAETADIDWYIIVVFTEDYRLRHFFKVPWTTLWQLSNQDKARRLVRWNKLEEFDQLQDARFCESEAIKNFL